ncbi:larval cuticle protein 65Ag1-like [Anopheles nili]|uniref:larval cuticle protein 65Ag1-like n=1 Tax=Anopheles nili TaxID=185578 RepID=UPI00237B2066|nr:larval cuticle protein 65Ag1-like [Anopheles nili]
MTVFYFLLLASAVSLISAAPVGEQDGDLVRYENEQNESGYRFSYETRDGQEREEVGTIDPNTGVLTVTGWYSFRAPDGTTHRVDFVADENGYRVTNPPVVEQAIGPQFAAAPINNALLLSLVG